MGRMNLNHWFINKNDLNISLMRFYVGIKRIVNDRADYCILDIIDNDRKRDLLGFANIEEAVNFTENEIVESHSLEEVQEKYQSKYINISSNNPKVITKKETTNKPYDTITLSEQEVYSAIVNYYAQFDEQVKAKKNLRIINGQLSLDFFKVQEFIRKKDIKIIETRLSEEELKYIFEYYLKDTNYNLVDYKYLGGIRRVGYFIDEDTPHFDGIELSIKGREKVRK